MGMPIVGVPEDDRQRHRRHGELLRVRHGGVASPATRIDRLHTTAAAHRRIMVVEVMGRYAGWIALHAGVSGGADIILIPEIPFDIEKVAQRRAPARPVRRQVHDHRLRRGGHAARAARRRSCAGDARRVRRALRRRRPQAGRGTRAPDGQGSADGRPRPPAARRHARVLRPRAGDALRCARGRPGGPRAVRQDGVEPAARHRPGLAERGRRQDEDRAARFRPHRRPRARSASPSATESPEGAVSTAPSSLVSGAASPKDSRGWCR